MTQPAHGPGKTPSHITPPSSQEPKTTWTGAITNFLKDALRLIGFEWKTASFEKPESKSEIISKIAQQANVDKNKLNFLKKLSSNDLNFLLRAIQNDERSKTNFSRLINETKWGPQRVLSSLRLATSILNELPAKANEKEAAALLADLFLSTPDSFTKLPGNLKKLQAAQKKPSLARAKPIPQKERGDRADLHSPPESLDRANPAQTTGHMLSAIYERTYPSNIQVPEYALQAMYTPLDSTDTRKHASVARGRGSFALQEEIQQPQSFLTDSDKKLETAPHVEIVISQPGTLNTSVLKLPLPENFKGMSETQAREALAKLKDTARTMGTAGEQWANKWVQEATAKMMDAFSSFSPEGMRIKRPYLSSPKAAIEAAMEQHTFQMQDGRHSLIPAISDNFPLQSCVTISTNEVLKLAILQQNSLTLPSKVTAKSFETIQATCTIGYKEVANGLAEITTTIVDPSGNKTERTTYRVREDDSGNTIDRAHVMGEYRTSGLFERDLLLAKAQFMQEYTEVT